jgi:hypothetical protein
MPKKPSWRPLQRANLLQEFTEADVQEAMRLTGADRATAIAALEAETRGVEYWINDIYQVALRRLAVAPGSTPMIHLNIRRRDGKPILRDWRHFQRIKNELIGEECEAVEIYPAESRLNDTSNKYHLWCFADPAFRLPFGMTRRDVIDADDAVRPGHRQRRIT